MQSGPVGENETPEKAWEWLSSARGSVPGCGGGTGSGSPGGNEGGSEKCSGEGLQKILAVLHRGGDVGADLGEPTGTRKSAKAAGDLLLDLEHAKVAFGQVVGEGDTEIDHEGKDAFLVELVNRQSESRTRN